MLLSQKLIRKTRQDLWRSLATSRITIMDGLAQLPRGFGADTWAGRKTSRSGRVTDPFFLRRLTFPTIVAGSAMQPRCWNEQMLGGVVRG